MDRFCRADYCLAGRRKMTRGFVYGWFLEWLIFRYPL